MHKLLTLFLLVVSLNATPRYRWTAQQTIDRMFHGAFQILVPIVAGTAPASTPATVTYDNAYFLIRAGNTHTIPFGPMTVSAAGAHRAAIVHIYFESTTLALGSVTFGGVSGAAITGADTTTTWSGTRLISYCVVDPAPGSQSGSFVFGGTGDYSYAHIGVVTATSTGTLSCTNGNQTTAVPSATRATSLAITSANGDLTTTLAVTGSNWCTTTTSYPTNCPPYTNQTGLAGEANAPNAYMDRGPGTGTTTHTWTDRYTGQNHGIVGANFHAQ